MENQATAFDRARAALHALGFPAIVPALRAAGIAIDRSVLGGSHSVAIYPPIDSLEPVDPAASPADLALGRRASLYLHVPFCETRCTFCHYTVRHYTGRDRGSGPDPAVRAYLDALKLELASRASSLRDTEVTSIYIGGGTPLVLEGAELADLLAAIRATCRIAPDAEICIEGSPLTIATEGGEDKLRLLRGAGVTRLSFGIQSFDDDVLRYAGRGYRRDVPIRAARIAASVFDNWNLDLIQGLYRGSPDEVCGNLAVLTDLMPPHLTWYHGRFADRPQGAWYRSAARRDGFEDEDATLLGRMLIWQGMAALGYARSDGNRFVRDRRHTDGFKRVRTSLSTDLLGIGTSAYSHVGARSAGTGIFGHVLRNDPTIRGYVDRIGAGLPPIVAGRAIDAREVIAMSYATGLRQGRTSDDALAAATRLHPGLAADHAARAQTLLDLNVLEDPADAGLRLSDLGRLFEDEVLSLFFSPAVRAALARRAQPAGIAASAALADA